MNSNYTTLLSISLNNLRFNSSFYPHLCSYMNRFQHHYPCKSKTRIIAQDVSNDAIIRNIMATVLFLSQKLNIKTLNFANNKYHNLHDLYKIQLLRTLKLIQFLIYKIIVRFWTFVTYYLRIYKIFFVRKTDFIIYFIIEIIIMKDCVYGNHCKKCLVLF